MERKREALKQQRHRFAEDAMRKLKEDMGKAKGKKKGAAAPAPSALAEASARAATKEAPKSVENL